MTAFIEQCVLLGAGFTSITLFVVWAVSESVGLFCNMIN